MGAAQSQLSPGFDWQTAAKGFQQAGASVAGGSPQQNYMSGVQYPASQQNPAGVPNTLIPQSQGSSEDIEGLIEALRRLSSQGKSGGSYMYVDPNAQFNPTETGNLGLLPQGTQPSF